MPGGTRKNLSYLDDLVEWGDLPEDERLVLADAQTSGGLLVAATDDRAGPLEEALERRAVGFAEIGRTIEGEPGRVTIRGRLTR